MNAASKNFKDTALINFDGKNLRYLIDCCILNATLSVIISPFISAVSCQYNGKHWSKLKTVLPHKE